MRGQDVADERLLVRLGCCAIMSDEITRASARTSWGALDQRVVFTAKRIPINGGDGVGKARRGPVFVEENWETT